MNPQKIVIAMPTEEEFMPSISRWGHEYVWTKKETYFVHVIKENISVSEMGVEEFPDKVTVENLKQQTLNFIKGTSKNSLPL